MMVFLNGRLVPEAEAVVSVLDRGLAYGDGLFETFRVFGGRAFRWDAHLARLREGVQALGYKLPYTNSELRTFASQLIREHKLKEGILRLVLTRGIGPEGYSPKGAENGSVSMSLHPAPEVDPEAPPAWRLVTSTHALRLNDPISKYKTCSRLTHVVARAEAEARDAQDALMLTSNREIASTATANLFWLRNGTVFTPSPACGALPGVTRGVVLEICQELNIPSKKILLRADLLRQSQGIFLTSTTWGVCEVISIDGYEVARAGVVQELSRAYWDRVRPETTHVHAPAAGTPAAAPAPAAATEAAG